LTSKLIRRATRPRQLGPRPVGLPRHGRPTRRQQYRGEERRRSLLAGTGDPLDRRYHDQEWGRPVADDRRLFEKLSLEGFQAGLSWLVILCKREHFREVFARFDPAAVARFEPST
jgi:hypothetical protein